MAEPEYSNDLKPYTWKSLRRFEWNGLEAPRFYIHTDLYNGPPTLEFHNVDAPPREIKFNNAKEMDAWILAHQKGIEQWAIRQATKNQSELVKIKFVERRFLGVLRQILSGNADIDVVKPEVWRVGNVIDTIQNPKIKDFLNGFSFNLTRPTMWKFLEEYHLTWLPEHIQELLTQS